MKLIYNVYIVLLLPSRACPAHLSKLLTTYHPSQSCRSASVALLSVALSRQEKFSRHSSGPLFGILFES